MGNEWDESSKTFLSEIKGGLQAAQQRLDQEGLKIDKLELELKTAVEKKVDGTLKFKIVELGADLTNVDTQTFTISLKPATGGVALMAGISDELVEGIEATVAVIREAVMLQPPFTLDESAVAVEMGRTKEGTAKIFVGGSVSKETTQTVTFTVKKAG